MDRSAPEDAQVALPEAYSDLAEAMARNSVYHAVKPDQVRDATTRALGKALELSRAPHIVVVVGAGASNAACDLPTGNTAAMTLREEMVGHLGLDAEVAKEIERIALQHNLLEEDFETVLLALSKFDRSFVLRRLTAIFGRRHHPWIGYELLAHFLKHRFVDAIINFNFDEILDQSISDELAEGAYHKVILDGDCPSDVEDWLNTDTGKYRLPLYLKPHGSASQPSSLRFTRESYTTLPEGFVEILRRLLLETDRGVHLLVLGHAMQSVEFNHLLRRALIGRKPEHPMKFYFVRPCEESLLLFKQSMESKAFRSVFPESNIDIDAALDRLWQRVTGHFCKGYEPRMVARHLLVSKLFKGRRIKDWKVSGREPRAKTKRLIEYFKARTYIELALAVAKAKGFASMEDLSGGRAGTYFRLYRETALAKPGNPSSELKSLEHACERLGLAIRGYGASAVTFDSYDEEAAVRKRSVIVRKRQFELHISQIVQRISDELRGLIALTDESIGTTLRTALMNMYCGEEVEVDVRKSETRSLSFEDATILTSFAALKWRTDELMQLPKSNWDTIVCTATSGQWLLAKRYVEALKSHDAILLLIVSDMTFERDLRRTFGARVCGIHWLPWWTHNRNVTVFLDDGTPRFAIAFERRLRTASITPYYLGRAADTRSAWQSFVGYWLKAECRNMLKPEEQITAKDLRKAERDLREKFRECHAKVLMDQRPKSRRGRAAG